MAASRRLDEQWPALERSLPTRIQVLRIEVVQLRARGALAMAARRTDVKSHLAVAEADARQIEGERMAWAEPHASLLRASIAAAKGDDRAAVRCARAALRGHERADMALYAAAARRSPGRDPRRRRGARDGEGLGRVDDGARDPPARTDDRDARARPVESDRVTAARSR